MPATEQTWRNPKLLHMVFGLSSLAMLLVTLWMFADDHEREWKQYQTDYYHRLEVWNLGARALEQQDQEYKRGLEARQAELAERRSDAPRQALVDLFKAEQVYFQVEQSRDKTKDEKEKQALQREFAQYVEFLPQAQNLLQAQSAVAAGEVELANLSGDVDRVQDSQRRVALKEKVDELTRDLAARKTALEAALEDEQKAAANLARMKDAQADTAPRGELSQISKSYEQLTKSESSTTGARKKFLDLLRAQIAQARFNEEIKQRDLKFRRADLDVARSDFGLRLGEGADESELAALQARVAQVRAEVDLLNDQAESLSCHRKQLDAVLAAMTAGEEAAQKAVEQHTANVIRLARQLEESQPSLKKTVLSFPILDAFSNDPQIGIKDKPRWLPDLTLNRNFNQVARFDRCEVCHLGVLKASPTSPTAPGYEHEETKEGVQLSTPELVRKGDEAYLRRSASDKELPAAFQQESEHGGLENFVGFLNREKFIRDYPDDQVAAFVLKVYGIYLAKEGLWRPEEAMIDYVVRESPGALAGLKRGDTLMEIDGQEIDGRNRAFHYLTEHNHWGKPLLLKVRRGVPHPFSSHPRLELYGSDLSPHPFGKFGCTICHDGQGNGTAFKWASHTPDTLSQAKDWATRLDWFDDLHWIYPMRPKRFAESNCLKCHHDLSELESSEKFTQAPAPNLTEGYHTIRAFGCFGCHEIKGYDGPTKRLGPDLRLEPNYSAAADQLRYLIGPEAKNEPEALHEIRGKALELRNGPENSAVRKQLQQLIATDAQRPKRMLSPQAHALVDLLKDEEAPGKLRKVGPSLRHVGSKLDEWFLYNQVNDPTGFRPSTRMPRFFGLHSLFDVGQDYTSQGGKEPKTQQEALDKTKALEQVEILSIVKYLQAKSQPIRLVNVPKRGEPPKESDPKQLGKFLFQSRGCLACHQHKAFPESKEDHGPDLSFVGDKLAGKDGANQARGRVWLYNWLRDPTNYHARTKMPNTFLEEYDELNAAGKQTGRKINPALEIMEFLLASRAGKGDRAWQAAEMPKLSINDATVKDLAMEHLRGASGFTQSQAESFLTKGILLSLAGELKGDEVELLQGPDGSFNANEKVFLFLGRRSISKYGCYGCHDVPGFEATKPIGTGLNEWGRKETSKIAFEQIAQFVGLRDHIDTGHGGHGGAKNGGHHAQPKKKLEDMVGEETDTAYFLNSLVHHQREGFLWQKLRDPRSFDFQKTQNKKYNERLKMPQFRFHVEEKENARLREKVMTFVLGLVNEPPAEKYLYKADARRTAINEGRRVLTKYNCGGCHTLEMDIWKIDFDPDKLVRDQAQRNQMEVEYPFLIPHYPKKQRDDSKREDERGLGEAAIVAQPARDATSGRLKRDREKDLADPGDPVYEFLELWKPAVINGETWLAKDEVKVPIENAHLLRGPVGGSLARSLAAALYAEERRRGTPSVSYEVHALPRVPPPLVHEGRKVQSAWLHDFLLDPYSIRPYAALRMPKFNMSSDEASALASYFAAIDDPEYPNTFNASTRDEQLQRADAQFPNRLDDAKKLIANKCLQCHVMGNYVPGDRIDKAPNLAQVYSRFRPEFLRQWLADPKRLLPYTGMPDNIPYKVRVKEKDKSGKLVDVLKDGAVQPSEFPLPENELGSLIHKGTSQQQLNAVVDFLLSYDRFSQRNEEIRPLSKAEPGKPEPGKTGP